LVLADKGKLQAVIDSLSVKKDVDITKMAADLKLLKELLDSNTITQEEFDKQKSVIMQKYQ
jgi:predicted Zn-dependent peptidase